MELAYQDLRNIKVAFKEGEILGSLFDTLVNTDTGIVFGYCLDRGIKNCFSVVDVISYERKLMTVNQNTVFNNKADFGQKGVVSGKGALTTKRVYTEDGVFIGTVKDFIIDTNINYLKCLYVVKSFFGFFIINTLETPFSSIVEIQKNKIIVKNICKPQKNLALKNLIPAVD